MSLLYLLDTSTQSESLRPARRRKLTRLAVVLGIPVVAVVFVRWIGLSYGGPHRIGRPAAALSPELAASVDDLATWESAGDAQAAIEQALDKTDGVLRFGLGHPTSLSFGEPRQGNCVEYAHLFATVFERIAQRRGLDARAHVVRSMRPRIFGLRVPLRGFDDHDWTLITDKEGHPLAYVDPTLHDALLGADIRGNVDGAVSAAGRSSAR